MTPQREPAEKLVEPYTPGTHPKFYTRNEVIDLITAALEQAERAGYERGIEDAATVANDHGLAWDDSWGNACRTISSAIRALKDVKP